MWLQFRCFLVLTSKLRFWRNWQFSLSFYHSPGWNYWHLLVQSAPGFPPSCVCSFIWEEFLVCEPLLDTVMQEIPFNPWVGKFPLRREWQHTPIFSPREFHGQRSLAGYSPRCHKEMDMTELLTLPLFGCYKDFHCLWTIQKVSKATFLNNHFTWKWILAFCSPVESFERVATYLVCSFGGEKQTPQTMLACWFLPWYGSSAWACQRKAGPLLISPPEPAPRISSLLRSFCQELEQDIKFFSTPKRAISCGRQVESAKFFFFLLLAVLLNWPSLKVSLFFWQREKESPLSEQVDWEQQMFVLA